MGKKSLMNDVALQEQDLGSFGRTITCDKDYYYRRLYAANHEGLVKVPNTKRFEDCDPETAFALEAMFCRPKAICRPDRSVKIVDLCCGSGGLALGVKAAVANLGYRAEVMYAADISEDALAVYRKNIRPVFSERRNLETLLKYSYSDLHRSEAIPNAESIVLHDMISDLKNSIDLFIAGPPCEGNSNANNVSRRIDPRNELYLEAVAIGVGLESQVIAIENTPTVPSGAQNVLKRSIKLLTSNGYAVSEYRLVLTASDFGAAQTRNRHFLIANKAGIVFNKRSFDGLRQPPISVGQLLTPLMTESSCELFDTIGDISEENMQRMKYLHENDVYDLPDELRPDCHRLKEHTYNAVYGRMYPDQPSSTLTTGFGSNGRGRFTHPYLPRGLTLREGAMLQGFPFDYRWLQACPNKGRATFQTMIGDAVPSQMGFAVGAAMMSCVD